MRPEENLYTIFGECSITDGAAEAVFLAGLPTGPNGDPIPGHTEWKDLGPQAKERCRRIAAAAYRYWEEQC